MSAGDVKHPENTPETLYVISGQTLGYVLEKAKEHFGVDDVSDLAIDSENIQIRNFGYDLYDGADWCQYLVITR
ncbi:hypothetical protein [Sphingomonas sp. 3-13AW]|uniref:hypothetical protein n=1 Tax=Sphingomonas sp. 3-13AW TaxID=3050450 RepID=UPI003BB61F10